MGIPSSIKINLLYAVYRLVCGTLRFREHGRKRVDAMDAQGESFVFCLWHDELFPLIPIRRQLDIVTVVSPSKDGDVLASLLKRGGARTARGSSTRGGVAALLNVAKLMNHAHVHAAVAVDGPRGPRHKIKDGVFFLAEHTSAWIMPVRIVPKRSYKAPSWDRFQIPLPFSRVDFFYGDPWKPEPGADMDVLRARLAVDFARVAGEDSA